jgi:molybdopterin-guanine dinucleotide biosynthesis protein A
VVKAITVPEHKEHSKHAKLARAGLGEWGRTELALLGAPCAVIRDFAERIIERLSAKWKIAWADADHHAVEAMPDYGSPLQFTDKISYTRIDSRAQLTRFQRHALFNDADAVWVNGNHFKAKQQILFIDPAKSMASKLEALSDVQLVLLKDKDTHIPEYLQPHLAGRPVLNLDDIDQITVFFEQYLLSQVAVLNGLVLAGGQSLRMGTDKGLLHYHGLPQREYVRELIRPFCAAVFLSCGSLQSGDPQTPTIEDRFLGIGPMGGILSAMQADPSSAWLVVACDLPHLSERSLRHLIAHRNPSRLATAFKEPGGSFPEPLITIWEPRAYPVLLHALSEGLSCPRKVLLASDIELLDAPDPAELQNVNDPAAYSEALSRLNTHTNDNL